LANLRITDSQRGEALQKILTVRPRDVAVEGRRRGPRRDSQQVLRSGRNVWGVSIMMQKVTFLKNSVTIFPL
jgi:hypothetical protein